MNDKKNEELRRMDDRLMGELVATVKALNSKVESLETTVTDLSAKMNTGRGVLIGALIAAGGLGAGASQLLERVLK